MGCNQGSIKTSSCYTVEKMNLRNGKSYSYSEPEHSVVNTENCDSYFRCVEILLVVGVFLVPFIQPDTVVELAQYFYSV